MRLTVFILGTILIMIILTGLLFRLLHFNGANELIMLGMTPFIFLFVPLAAIYQYRKGKL